MADIIGDADVLQQASEDVNQLLKEDHTLSAYPEIQKQLSSFATDNNMIL